ncbi:MAG: hypothetical protein IH787_04570 [Nitrospirae bacterium]|nr:hypothetical protein [Nitrospirota bacterium]
MQPAQERRRLGPERRSYQDIRVYARMVTWSSFVVLVLGAVLGVLIIWFGAQPLWARVSNGFWAMVAGGVYFILARASADILYLLLDMARNSYLSKKQTEGLARSESHVHPAA